MSHRVLHHVCYVVQQDFGRGGRKVHGGLRKERLLRAKSERSPQSLDRQHHTKIGEKK